MKIYLDGNYITLQGLSKDSGLGAKMISYLRYKWHMIPPPVKTSNGNGVKALYPQYMETYLKRIVQERRKGLKYSEINEKLVKEKEEAFIETDLLRRFLKADRQARLELSASIRSNQPDIVIHASEGVGKTSIIVEAKMQEIKEDLKKHINAWDGKSLDRLTHIRQKIDELEVLTAKQRITKTLLKAV